ERGDLRGAKPHGAASHGSMHSGAPPRPASTPYGRPGEAPYGSGQGPHNPGPMPRGQGYITREREREPAPAPRGPEQAALAAAADAMLVERALGGEELAFDALM